MSNLSMTAAVSPKQDESVAIEIQISFSFAWQFLSVLHYKFGFPSDIVQICIVLCKVLNADDSSIKNVHYP